MNKGKSNWTAKKSTSKWYLKLIGMFCMEEKKNF